MMRGRAVGIVPACLLLLLLAACQMVPITGERELILITRGQELALGEEAFKGVLKESKLSDDQAAVAILERVGRRIAAKAHEPDFQWEFKLIESDQVNAFCLPGGKVAVYTGILPVCKNEAGLAAVIGHEVSHAVARHGAVRMSHGLVADLLGAGISEAMQSSDPRLRAGVLAAYGAGATVGVMLPYSRKHENQADEIGLRFMARAGYDPSEAVAFWERMAKLGGARPPEFLSTHPAPENRIERLRRLLPAAREEYGKATGKYGSGETLPEKRSRRAAP